MMRWEGQCAGGSEQREMVGRSGGHSSAVMDILSAVGSHQKIMGMCDGLNGNVPLRL